MLVGTTRCPALLQRHAHFLGVFLHSSCGGSPGYLVLAIGMPSLSSLVDALFRLVWAYTCILKCSRIIMGIGTWALHTKIPVDKWFVDGKLYILASLSVKTKPFSWIPLVVLFDPNDVLVYQRMIDYRHWYFMWTITFVAMTFMHGKSRCLAIVYLLIKHFGYIQVLMLMFLTWKQLATQQ